MNLENGCFERQLRRSGTGSRNARGTSLMRAIPVYLVRTVRKFIPTVAVVRGYKMSYVAANALPAPH